jgi:NTE family protein
MNQKTKIGLSLSGGGARGIAHIGVLQALEENNIYPSAIAGTSAGAIVGGLYAAGKRPDEILAFVKNSSFFAAFLKGGLPSAGLIKLTYLKEKLNEQINEDSFEALEIPLYVALSNLNTGECDIFSEGPVIEAIIASASVPLIFKPVRINGDVYVDGGLLNNMPVHPLKKTTDKILGVNVMPNRGTPRQKYTGALSIAGRCFDLSIYANTKPNLSLCDVVIEPEGVSQFNIFHFNQFKTLYEIGYEAAIEKMDLIKEKLLD